MLHSRCRDCFITDFEAETIFLSCIHKKYRTKSQARARWSIRVRSNHRSLRKHAQSSYSMWSSSSERFTANSILLLFRNSSFVLKLCKLSVEQGNSSQSLAISAPGLFTFFFPPFHDVTRIIRWLKVTIFGFHTHYVGGTSAILVSILSISNWLSNAHLDLRNFLVHPFLNSGYWYIKKRIKHQELSKD